MSDRQTEAICVRLGLVPFIPESRSKIGLAVATLGRAPIHGLRHAPEGGSSGWYIWCGDEWRDDPAFFAPLHIEHLQEWLPAVLPYLSLPAGYRFIIDEQGYEDVWFDESLLDTSNT